MLYEVPSLFSSLFPSLSVYWGVAGRSFNRNFGALKNSLKGPARFWNFLPFSSRAGWYFFFFLRALGGFNWDVRETERDRARQRDYRGHGGEERSRCACGGESKCREK